MAICKMHEKQINSANILRVAAGTTGLRGGDSGHGGVTIIELEDLGGTDIEFVVSGNDRKKLEIKLAGDSELATIIEGFEFVVETLRREMDKSAE